ncbi:MAG: Fumarate hydratase class I, N-terminal domain (TtdA) [Acetothermia bacterium 64_32]|nr:MAG: Fumarate hydratase class I, N-terminal domain (TtdA) [Acetothermia bacterium 64_32]
MSEKLVETLAEALGQAATVLPNDVISALERARDREEGPARVQLEAILRNVEIAKAGQVPICQDTGTPTFFVRFGTKFPYLEELLSAIPEAVRLATRKVPLRPNTVHPLTGENPGDNTGRHIPHVTWLPVPGDGAEIFLLPKGGGSENCCALKMLTPGLGIKGVKKAVVEHVVACGGKPCPPTVVGVGIGGGADLSLKLGKLALLRPVGERHPEREVAALEEELEELINASGVGPMGLGGKTTVLAVHVEYAHRHPASLPLGIVVQCWADRRAHLRISPSGEIVIRNP